MRRRAAFTLIELLVVISIIMLLAALALPVLMKAARQARNAACVSNVRQWFQAIQQYAHQYDGYYVRRPDASWLCGPNWMARFDVNPKLDLRPGFVRPYLNEQAVVCPVRRRYQWPWQPHDWWLSNYCVFAGYDSQSASVAEWPHGKPPKHADEADREALIGDVARFWPGNGWGGGHPQRDNSPLEPDGINVGYADGSAGWLPRDRFKPLYRLTNGYELYWGFKE